jgi:hypothetical protein
MCRIYFCDFEFVITTLGSVGWITRLRAGKANAAGAACQQNQKAEKQKISHGGHKSTS